MNKDAELPTRKKDHLQINLQEDVSSSVDSGFDQLQFIHKALPEINLEDVDTHTVFLGKTLSFPLLISSMTGGTPEAAKLNVIFAEAAQEFGIAMGVGSQRAAIENPDLAWTFQVRNYAPDALLFANLGAVQLNYGFGVEECQRAVDMIGADVLALHLNPLQEALQPEGNTNFSGLLAKIELVCKKLNVPVIVKEVGWGIDGYTASKLANVGVAGIDIAGAGGTSWSQVEMYRQEDSVQAEVAKAFSCWGIPTVKAIQDVRAAVPHKPLIASGSIQSGIDLAKSLALGANLGGMAGPLLRAAEINTQKLHDTLRVIQQQLRLCLFSCGKPDISSFDNTVLQG